MVLARTGDPNAEPLMIASETGAGRVIAFGGETWVWPRASDQGQAAHRKFWRQVIFWLSHKEDEGDDKIKLTLDTPPDRGGGEARASTVTARDAKNVPIPNLTYQAAVTLEGSKNPEEPVPVYNEGDESSRLLPGDRPVRRVSSDGHRRNGTARRSAATVPASSSTRTIARWRTPPPTSICSGRSPRPREVSIFPRKSFPSTSRASTARSPPNRMTQIEHRIWDNWPFFLIFTALLTLEWWLRKRHGWV